jgi:pimeloyl-ACP methyl ester carboxylesterase
MVVGAAFRGGVADPDSIPPALAKEMYLVGNRPGHYQAFLTLLRHGTSWEDAAKDYRRIEIPVLLVWGDHDWARKDEREHDRALIPGVEMVTGREGRALPAARPPA